MVSVMVRRNGEPHDCEAHDLGFKAAALRRWQSGEASWPLLDAIPETLGAIPITARGAVVVEAMGTCGGRAGCATASRWSTREPTLHGRGALRPSRIPIRPLAVAAPDHARRAPGLAAGIGVGEGRVVTLLAGENTRPAKAVSPRSPRRARRRPVGRAFRRSPPRENRARRPAVGWLCFPRRRARPVSRSRRPRRRRSGTRARNARST